MQERAAAARAAALADPVTGALTAFGVAAPRAELVTGLTFAAVLEAVVYFCGLHELRPAAVTEVPITLAQRRSHAEEVTPVTPESNAVEAAATPVAVESAPALRLLVVEQHDDVTRVTAAIAARTLRATVIEIRKFPGCSRSRAAAVRTQIDPVSTHS